MVRRISHESSIKGGGSEDLFVSLAEQDLTVQRWSILWRTIILSALGETIYPYSKHLRVLDLSDLDQLLQDDKFRQGKIMQKFFSGPLARFNLTIETPLKTGTRGRPKRLDVKGIISAIGEVITEQSPLLEELSEPTTGDLLSTALLTWAPRLTHLRRLDLFDAKALGDETVRNLLHVHCPKLDNLRIYQYVSDDADQQLAMFINGMQENSLLRFENISNCRMGTETCLALNAHGKSLKALKLHTENDGLLACRYLQGCTGLETIAIEDAGPTQDLKATQNDVYLEMVEWLKSCTALRDISLSNIQSAPDLLTPVLLNSDIALTKLQINAKEGSMYIVKDHHDFHESLGQKSSLREVLLRADPEAMGRDDLEVLMNTFCALTNLRTLNLTRISDYFNDEHIKLLARNLPELEDLYVGGFGITDAVLVDLASLRNIKSLTFSGLTSLTADGLLDFVGLLGEGNRGILLAIDNADMDSAISPEGQDLVRETLAEAVEGRFQYQLLRGKAILLLLRIGPANTNTFRSKHARL